MNNQTIGFSVSIMIHSLFGILFLAGGTSFIGTPGPIALDFTLVTSTPATTRVPEAKPVHNIETTRVKEKSPPAPRKMMVKQKQDSPATVASHSTEQPEEIMAVQEEPLVQEVTKPAPMPVTKSAHPDNSPTNQEAAAVESAAKPVLPAAPSHQALGAIYYKKHFNYIKDGIQRRVIYPRQAKMMGWEGRVVLSFTICANGRVEGITIIESSGFKILDNKAVETIKKAAPFPRPPVAAKLTIPIVFRLV